MGHLPEFLPEQQGFDYYYGIPYSNDMDSDQWGEYLKRSEDPDYFSKTEFFNVPLIENTRVIERPADQTTITKRYTEKAIQFIEQNKAQPFFLYLAHSMPHIPLFVSEEFRGRSKASLYVDVIEEIDWSVGELLKALKKSTGPKYYSRFYFRQWSMAFVQDSRGSAGPLRAGKGTTFEGGQRVPTVFGDRGLLHRE